MNSTYHLDKIFEKTDFSETPLPGIEYENCRFDNCNLSYSDLSKMEFTNCDFVRCNLSLATLNHTSFLEVRFTGCKMLGLLFENCNEFGVSFQFEDCNLNQSSFFQKKIKKTIFKNSPLQESDFTECDASESVFDNCDLAKARFDHTNLEKADFRTSFNYSIDPEINQIKQARFSFPGITGLLDKYDIDIEL